MAQQRDALGVAYERRLAKRKTVRKARGAFYTPVFLVDYLVKHTLGSWLENKTPAQAQGLRILDPACGGGAFLLGSLELLLRWYRQFSPSVDGREIASRHLFGVDSDSQAVAIARQSLREMAGCSLAMNIRVADALSDPGFDIDGAVDPRGYDIVLANPPFLNGVEAATRLHPQAARKMRSRFRSAAGTIDQSILFQELCLRLLKEGGRCGVVTPNKFLSAPFGRAFRKMAGEMARLELLADFSTAGLFANAAVYPVAYVLSRNSVEQLLTTVEVYGRASRETAGQGIVPAPRLLRRSTVEIKPTTVATWDQLVSTSPKLLRRLDAEFLPLGKHFEVAASATAAEAYALREWIVEGQPAGIAFRFVTSGAIDRYVHHHGRRKMRYLKRDYAAPFLPMDCPALRENRKRQYSSEKLVLAGLARGIEAIWDDGQVAGSVPSVQVLGRADSPMPLKALLGILNSSVAGWWFGQTYRSLSLAGGYQRIGTPQVGSIPLWPRAVTERYDQIMKEIAQAVEERLVGCMEAERRIDGLVRQWYGIGEREELAAV